MKRETFDQFAVDVLRQALRRYSIAAYEVYTKKTAVGFCDINTVFVHRNGRSCLMACTRFITYSGLASKGLYPAEVTFYTRPLGGGVWELAGGLIQVDDDLPIKIRFVKGEDRIYLNLEHKGLVHVGYGPDAKVFKGPEYEGLAYEHCSHVNVG